MANLKTDVYNVVDDKGNVVDTLRFTEGGSLYKNANANIEAGKENIVYRNVKNAGGGEKYEPLFTAEDKLIASPISMDFNSKTGKIQIKAPKEVLESDWFKEKYKNNDTFKTIAAMYKKDPSGNTGVQIQKKDGTIETKKVSDWFEEEKEALKDYASDYITKIVPIRDEIKNSTKSGIALSDTQVVISQSGLNRNEYKYDTDSVVYLPSAILRLGNGAFENMGSWNADTQTINAKDFYEWYNLHDDKGKDILEMEKVLNWQLDYFMNAKEHGEGDAEQLARTLSFYKTLKADDPEADFIEGFGLFMQSFGRSFEKTIVDASVNLYGFIEDALASVANVTSYENESGRVIGALTLNLSGLLNLGASYGAESIEAAKTVAYNFGEIIAGIDGNQSEQNAVNSYIAIGDLTRGLMAGNGKETFERWAEQTGIPTNQEALKVIGDTYDRQISSLAEISGAANAGRVIGSFAGEIVKQIALTNVIGGAVGATVKGAISAGAATSYKVFNFGNDIAGLTQALAVGVDKYTKMASLADSTYAFAKATEVIAGSTGMVSNLLAQGLVDTVLNDEDTIHDMLLNPNDETRDAAFKAIQKNALMNVFGEVTGFGIGLGGKAKKGATKWIVENTTAGATVDAATKRAVNWVAGKKHVALANFAEWMSEGNSKAARFFDKIFKASDEASKWYADLHWSEAQAAFNVAHAAKGADSIEAANKATAQAVLDKMQLEVSLNRVTRGVMRVWLSLTKNPAIVKQYGDFQNAMSKAIAAEGANSVEIAGMKYLSQETSDYIALRSIVEKLTKKEIANNGLSALESSYKTALEDRIAKYVGSHSEEVKAAADEVLSQFRAYEKAYMDLAVKGMGDDGGLGLYDEETVKGWRDTKYWGDEGQDYIPLVAVKDGESNIDAMKRASADWEKGGNYKAKLSVDEYEAKPGDVDAHYLDPSLALYSQQVTAAKVITARDWGDVLLKTDPIAKEINLDGMPVTKSDVSKARTQIRHTVSETFESFRTTDDIWNYGFASAFKKGTASAGEKAGRRVLRVLGLNRKDSFNRAAYSLEPEDISALTKQGYNIPEFGKMRNKYQLETFYDSLPAVDKKIVDSALGSEPLTVKNFNNALDASDMRIKLQRNYVSNNIAKNADGNFNVKYNEYVIRMKEKSLNAEAQTKLKTAYEEYSKALEQASLRVEGLDDFSKMISGFVEDSLALSTNHLKNNAFLNQMLKRYAEEGVPEDVAKRYLLLQEYKNYFAKGTDKKAFRAMLDKNLSSLNISGNLTTKGKLSLVNSIRDGMEQQIESEWAKSVNAVKAAGGADLLDTEDIFNYIYKQMSDFVDTTVKNPNVIQILDKNGEFHLYEVSPSTANLYTTRPDFSAYKNKGLSAFFNKTNRLARIGNVGYSLKSFMNQWMRDPMNAYVMGGMMRTLKSSSVQMGELLGPQVVEMMQEVLGEAGWKEFTGELTEQLGREATQEELQVAAKEALSDTQLQNMAEMALGDLGPETQYYREMAAGYKDAMWERFEEEASMGQKALNSLEQHSPGNFRETYLRKGVYAQSFNDAISMGKTIKEAKVIAEFNMLNATTNFSRAFAWGNNWTHSVSFLGAAINGKASFWRLLEVDPVGVSSRFINGLIIPVMALTSQSLQSESDREIYKNIPEYEKEDSIVFVVNGTKMKIPIPQELSAFVAPFRQVVEKSYDANRHSWNELIMNDILATSSIDLSGVMDLDANMLYGDLTLGDRLSSEAQTLISQLSPTIVKTAYMAITGVDPYTGNKIDASKIWIDEDGNAEIYDYKSSAFTSWLSSALKGVGINLSGSAAHALIQSLLGNGGSDVLDMIGDLFSGNPKSLYETPAESALSAFQSKSSTDAAQYAWNEAVRTLRDEKEAILNSKEYQNIAQSLSMLDSTKADYEKKRTNLLREYNELVKGYQEKVYTVVKRLQSAYGKEYDQNKFASTISLLTFKKNFGTALTEVEKEATKTLSYEARSRALQTMAEYGFDNPSDLSIFGYMRTDEYGNTEMKMVDPVAILNMNSEVWGQTDTDIAEIEAILDGYDIKRKNMFGDEYQKAKKAGKSALKEYKAKWNAKVVKAIYPYIKSRGIDNVLKNFRTQDILDNIIFIDNPYKTKESLRKLFGGK